MTRGSTTAPKRRRDLDGRINANFDHDQQMRDLRKWQISGDQEAINRVLASLEKLLWSVAHKYVPPGMPPEDMMQCLRERLIGNVLPNFNCDSGIRLSTYTVAALKRHATRSKNNDRLIHIPEHMMIRSAQAGTMGDLPAVVEKLEEPNLKAMRGEDLGQLRVWNYFREPDIADKALSEISVATFMAKIRPIDRHIIEGRMDNKTLDVIGAELGISRQNVQRRLVGLGQRWTRYQTGARR